MVHCPSVSRTCAKIFSAAPASERSPSTTATLWPSAVNSCANAVAVAALRAWIATGELNGSSGLVFRRNSVTGTVEAVTRPGKQVSLNADLHAGQ